MKPFLRQEKSLTRRHDLLSSNFELGPIKNRQQKRTSNEKASGSNQYIFIWCKNLLVDNIILTPFSKKSNKG